MVNDLPLQPEHQEMERNAYNAAFYELGLRWHWDSNTYTELLNQSSNTTERIRHYLETRQPHLLKAYDASFLADVIQAKKAVLSQDWMSRNAGGSRHFDWSQTLGGELGA